jgi:type I restriction enzyme R subunit
MNQNPEQLARDRIDSQLSASGWIIQDKKSFNLTAGKGVAIKEHHSNIATTKYTSNKLLIG